MQKQMDVMNTQEAAGFLKVHVETIRRLARRGEIPAFKVGKDWRFYKEAFHQWTIEQGAGVSADWSASVVSERGGKG